MDTLAIIKRIEMRLSEIGMSKALFYQRSGISSASLSQWRTGTYKPSLRKIEKAAEVLGVSSDYLLHGFAKSGVTSYQNGISAYYGNTVDEINQKLKDRDPGTYQVVYRAPGIVITVDNDSKATEEQINSVIAIYNSDYSPNEKKPTVSGERTIDLSEVDFAFYGGYKELDEDDQETIRDMVRIMRERRKNK